MILHVDYRYTAGIIPPRKRNPVERVYRGTVPVEVREAEAGEAPVAMRFRSDVFFDEAPPGTMLDLRWLDGKLWRPCFDPPARDVMFSDGPMPPAVRRGVDWLEACARTGYRNDSAHGSPFPTGFKSWGSTEEPPRIGEDPEARTVQTSNAGEREADIAKAAARFLVVDGIVHRTCPEPVYEIRPGDRFVHPVLLGSVNSNTGPERIFRADELDLIMGMDRLDEVPEESRIEVLIPEAVRFDGPMQCLIRSADSALSWMKNAIAERDVEFFRTYAAMRDGLRAFTSWRGALEHPPVDDAEFSALCRETMEAAGGEGGFDAHRMSQALDRLDARALASDFGAGPRP
jgi:hypothetical protein